MGERWQVRGSSGGTVTVITWNAASAEERQMALTPAVGRRTLQWALLRQFREDWRVGLVRLCRALNRDAVSVPFADPRKLVRIVLDAVERGRLIVVADHWLDGQSVAGTARLQDAASNGSDSSAISLAGDLIGRRGDMRFEGGRYLVATTPADFRLAVSQGFRSVSPTLTALTIKRMSERLAGTAEERARWSQLLAFVSQGDGSARIALLRFAPTPTGPAKTRAEPAITPAQLRQAIAPEHWFEVVVTYDDGTPYDLPCVLELPNGVRSVGPPDEDGRIRVDHLPASGTCVLSFPLPDQ